MRSALLGLGENLKSDASAAWLKKIRTDRIAAANLLIFHFTAKCHEMHIAIRRCDIPVRKAEVVWGDSPNLDSSWFI